jgi:regulator of protease activity HflC (stomatin/prohibitin superfamily)
MEPYNSINTEVIRHSTITRFFIKHGQIALAWYKSKPIFINTPGLYEFDDANFILDRCESMTKKEISLGSKCRILVSPGEIGLALHENKSIFLDTPNVYEFDDPNFIFKKFVAMTEKQITLGSKTRIIVQDGEVGISYVNGRLTILQPNIYTFDVKDQVFQGFLSTKQLSIQLDDVKTGILRCETKDFVEVGIRAAVYYRIGNPEKALKTVGDSEAITHIVKETCIASLQSILRSTSLNQVAQSKVVNTKSAVGTKLERDPFGSMPEEKPAVFFEKVHDAFIANLHDTFNVNYGIDISNIRIEEFKMMNAELAKNISNQAIITAQTETQLANLESQREIATAQQERDAAVNRIKADAEARKLDTETRAKTSAILLENETKARGLEIMAAAEAKSATIRAEADANARAMTILKIGEAEAKAIELKADAEKKRAMNLESTEIGKKLALYQLHTEMVGKAMQGVQKIIWVPQGSNLAAPMQLFGMPNVDNIVGAPGPFTEHKDASS